LKNGARARPRESAGGIDGAREDQVDRALWAHSSTLPEYGLSSGKAQEFVSEKVNKGPSDY